MWSQQNEPKPSTLGSHAAAQRGRDIHPFPTSAIRRIRSAGTRDHHATESQWPHAAGFHTDMPDRGFAQQ